MWLTCAMANRTWRTHATDTASRDELLGAAAALLRNRALRGEWRHWCELSQSKQTASHALLRWRHAALAAALDTWRGFASARAEALEELQSCVAVFLNRALHAGWRSWVDSHAAAAAEAESRALMRRVIGRFMQQQLARGWSQLEVATRERSEALGRLRAGVVQLQNRDLGLEQTLHP